MLFGGNRADSQRPQRGSDPGRTKLASTGEESNLKIVCVAAVAGLLVNSLMGRPHLQRLRPHAVVVGRGVALPKPAARVALPHIEEDRP